jgi:hypothetical protein
MANKPSPTVDETTIEVGEHKIEEFAEDLGRLLGTARSKAEGWIGQRKAISEHLAGIRDTATGLLAQLGLGDGAAAPAKRKPGRPRAQAATAPVDVSPAPLATATPAEGRKPRTMSAEARARISAAQKKRWAKLRRSQSK